MRKQRRTAGSYARRGPVREAYAYVLIACEGTKTEPQYFFSLCSTYRLSSANVRIVPPPTTDPFGIVTFAAAQIASEGYDFAFCVFDRDGHSTYDDALLAVRDSPYGRSGRLIAIPSVPCFEFWVLLHFKYSASAFATVGKKSACDRVIEEVRKHFPSYSKGTPNVFDHLHPKLDQALNNARRLEKHNLETGSANPGTRVHYLIEYLKNLKTEGG